MNTTLPTSPPAPPTEIPPAIPATDVPIRRWVPCAKCGVPLGVKGLPPARKIIVGDKVTYQHSGPCPSPGLAGFIRNRYGFKD